MGGKIGPEFLDRKIGLFYYKLNYSVEKFEKRQKEEKINEMRGAYQAQF